MNKLDEIEANLQIVNTMMLGIPAQKHVENVRLLIRTVRQLDEFRKWVVDHPGAPIAPEHLIFPDVLELLEE